jgi:hypothetical protein
MSGIIVLLSYCAFIFPIIPIIIFFISADTKAKTTRAILYLSIASLLSDSINEIYVRSGHKGYIVYNIYFLVECGLLIYLFFIIGTIKKELAAIAAFSFLLLFAIVSLYYQNIHTYQNSIRLLGSCFFIICGLSFYGKFNKELPVDNPWTYDINWFVFAITLYYTQGLVTFGISRYVFENMPSNYGMNVWLLHLITDLIKNILFSIGLYYSRTKD